MTRAAIVVLLILPALVLCSGCAFGVRMTDERAAVCWADGCAPLTLDDLRELERKARGAGYQNGWRDALRQRSEGI